MTFNKCYNNSKVKGNYAGGIVGGLYIGTLKIWNCGVSLNSEIIGNDRVGGILGIHSNYGTNYIYNSYVLGKISGNKYVGGIAGNVYYANWNQRGGANIQNVYFAGTIEGGTNVGGIIGRNSCDDFEKLSVTNCYYINTVEKGISNDEKEGITALSEEDMREKDTLLTYLKSYKNTEQELSIWDKIANEYPVHGNS